jgi:hypothetical protein
MIYSISFRAGSCCSSFRFVSIVFVDRVMENGDVERRDSWTDLQFEWEIECLWSQWSLSMTKVKKCWSWGLQSTCCNMCSHYPSCLAWGVDDHGHHESRSRFTEISQIFSLQMMVMMRRVLNLCSFKLGRSLWWLWLIAVILQTGFRFKVSQLYVHSLEVLPWNSTANLVAASESFWVSGLQSGRRRKY